MTHTIHIPLADAIAARAASSGTSMRLNKLEICDFCTIISLNS